MGLVESLKIFWRCLRNPEYRSRVKRLDERSDEALEEAGAIRLIARLQEEGRLVDFLMEEIERFPDAQVGAAVRSIHARCRRVLGETFELAPVLAGREGETVDVREGFDPLEIRLEGNIGARPPFRGILKHPGWSASAVKLAPASPDRRERLIAPAEVEVP